ncbi:MAG: glycosyltransferase [Cellulosilyticaceae bacterium]
MKVYFFLLGQNNSTTSFSNLMFAHALINKGYDVDIITSLEEKYARLQDCKASIIFFQKIVQCPAHTSKAISHLKGKVFLCHIDDDFQDMQNAEHINTLQLTDLILVGTNRHKEVLKNFTTQPVETISCLLDQANYPYTPANAKHNHPLIIGWQQSCADAYIQDLLSIRRPLLDLYYQYGFTLNLFGWHMGVDYRDLSGSVRDAFPFAHFIPYEPMDSYIRHIIPQVSQSDIFILPYIDIPDRIGKSGFSLKRMMHLGLPIVASATEHHRTLIDHNVSGFLAHTENDWYYYLEWLLVDASLRLDFSQAAHHKMATYYHEDAVITRFITNVSKHFSPFQK